VQDERLTQIDFEGSLKYQEKKERKTIKTQQKTLLDQKREEN